MAEEADGRISPSLSSCFADEEAKDGANDSGYSGYSDESDGFSDGFSDAEHDPLSSKSKAPVSLAKKTAIDQRWKRVVEQDGDLPPFTNEDSIRAVGAVMARLDHLEKCQKADRQRILFLEVKRRDLQDEIKRANSTFEESLKGCALLPDAPPYELVNEQTHKEPRRMVWVEMKHLEDELGRLKDGGSKMLEVCRIVGVKPDPNGYVDWNILKWSSRTTWQVFYFLQFNRVRKRVKVSKCSKGSNSGDNPPIPIKGVTLTRPSDRADSDECDDEDEVVLK